jgi:hypothetical protein
MRQGADDQLGLVIDSLALPGRMQRDRKNHVRVEISSGLGHHAGQLRGKPAAQPRRLLVLEQA